MVNATLSRRGLLGAGVLVAGAWALGGCTAAPTATATAGSSCGEWPRFDRVGELLTAQRFMIAHRGSGDNWPEHTLQAYTESLAAGAAAVEISVRATSDGVLVCHHDADTGRTCGTAVVLAETPWARVSELRVDARRWLGPGSQPQPIPRLADVLAALPPGSLAFVEDKDGSNTVALLDLLDDQPNARERFVWKQWAGAKQVGAASDRGYVSWGYFTPDIVDRLDELAPQFTALGIGTASSDEVIKRVVANGRPVIAWEVHRRGEANRLARLGVAGLMCANVRYVGGCAAAATVDDPATGLRPAGDLPASSTWAWSSQPQLRPDDATLRLDPSATPSYLLGSLCPLAAEDRGYAVHLSLAWPDGPGEAGLGFARQGDEAYLPYPTARANQAAGFRLRATPDGRIELAEQSPGSAINGLLASADTGPVAPGASLELTLTVTAGRIVIRAGGAETSINNVSPRGGYLHLWARGAVVDVGAVRVEAA